MTIILGWSRDITLLSGKSILACDRHGPRPLADYHAVNSFVIFYGRKRPLSAPLSHFHPLTRLVHHFGRWALFVRFPWTAPQCPALEQDVCVRLVCQKDGPAVYQQRSESQETSAPHHGRHQLNATCAGWLAGLSDYYDQLCLCYSLCVYVGWFVRLVGLYTHWNETFFLYFFKWIM